MTDQQRRALEQAQKIVLDLYTEPHQSKTIVSLCERLTCDLQELMFHLAAQEPHSTGSGQA